MEIFSVRLKWLREREGMSQKELSEKLEMSPQGYGKIENGQREPNLDTLVKLRKIFKEPLDFLLGISDFTIDAMAASAKFRELQDVVIKLHDKYEETAHSPELIALPDEFVDIDEYRQQVKKSLEWRKERLKELEQKFVEALEGIPLLSETTKKAIEGRKDKTLIKYRYQK